MKDFEEFISKKHPDPDHITKLVTDKQGRTKEYIERDAIVRLAEDYASYKLIEFRKIEMIKKGLNRA